MDTERLNFAAGYAIDNISDVRIRRQDMDTIELPLLDWESSDTTYTALLISCKDNTGAVHSRAEWLEIMREQFKLPFTIGLPCGKIITCKTLEDIPLEDLPCPCGNPNHWLVKWSPWPAEIPGGQR